jgi:hypothetical protein
LALLLAGVVIIVIVAAPTTPRGANPTTAGGRAHPDHQASRIVEGPGTEKP